MGLSRTVYEIDRDFSRKSQNFPTLVFCALAEEVPLGIGYWGWGSDIRQKTRMMGLPGRQMMFDDIFSRLDTMHQRDRRTDRRISQQRPHLRITSRGKNYVIILSVFLEWICVRRVLGALLIFCDVYEDDDDDDDEYS